MKTFIIVAFALLGVASARVIREAPVSDAFAKAEHDLKEFADNFMKILGFENEGDFKNKAHETGKKIAESWDQLALDIQQKTVELKDSPAIKDLNENIKKTIDDFKANNPNAEGFINDANKRSEEIINKIKEIADSDETKNIKDLSQNLLETASKTLNKLRDELVETVKAKGN